MNQFRWMLYLITLIAGLGLIAGCPETGDDDDDTADCKTVTDVCTKVFECGGWGWADMAECEDGFIDNAAYSTECTDTDGYLCCVADCMDLECDPFGTCEGGCWTDNCM